MGLSLSQERRREATGEAVGGGDGQAQGKCDKQRSRQVLDSFHFDYLSVECSERMTGDTPR